MIENNDKEKVPFSDFRLFIFDDFIIFIVFRCLWKK